MFPFTPIDQQSLVYGAWGTPLHGVYEFIYGDPVAVEAALIPNDRSGVITFVDDPAIRIDRSFDNWQSTPAARLVDTGSTFERNPNLADFDLERGNEWRNKAIVNGTGFISKFYTRLNSAGAEWIYTAPDKSRWSIAAIFTYFEPDRITGSLVATPFGEFKYLNEFWGIEDEPDDDFPSFNFEIDGPAGVSDSTGTIFDPYILDISNDGTMALVALGRPAENLYPLFNQTTLGAAINLRKTVANAMDNQFPNHHQIHAIELFTLSGTPNDPDDPFVVELSIYKDQVTASGTTENDQDDEVSFRVWSAYYAARDTNPFSRPNLTTVPPGSTEDEVSAILPHISLGFISKEDLAFCGWGRTDCQGNDFLALDIENPTDTQWIIHTGDPDQTDDGDITEWEASVEYKPPPAFPDEDFVKYNGFAFEVTVEHTSDPVVRPGVGGAWQDNWKVLFDDPEMVIGDIPLWEQETNYSSFDAVHDAAFDYYIAKGTHESDDADESINEPGAGSDWPNFWEGPFLVAVADFWVPDRLFFEGWIIRHEYTEPAFSADADLDVNTARFKVIRSHESSAITEPGTGANWRTFWEKANVAGTFQDEWVPPVEFSPGVVVDNTGTGGDDLRYTCVLLHTSTDDTRPPSAFWVETITQPTVCPVALADSIGGPAYHLGRGGSGAPPGPPGIGRGVTGHKAENLDIDFHVKDVYVWANFKDDNSIRDYTIDLRYEQTKRDLDIDICWNGFGRTEFPLADNPLGMKDDDVGVYSGQINRGPSTVDEKLTYIFRTDGTERNEITILAQATASGEDIWTENFSTYPLTWDPAGSRTLQVFLEAELYGEINETFSKFDDGNTDFPVGSFQKADWGPNGRNNDFCSGLTFQFIDNTYMDAFLVAFRRAFNPDIRAFPGPHLTSLVGGTVVLEPITPVTDDQFDFRPQRTQRQKDEGDPVPAILTTIYSPKLVGPLVVGRKRHPGIGQDVQYDSVLEPNDFPWQQFGVFGPDAEEPTKATLNERSPTVGIEFWLQDRDYGDDISCTYDPFTHTIERNNQYKVVYL